MNEEELMDDEFYEEAEELGNEESYDSSSSYSSQPNNGNKFFNNSNNSRKKDNLIKENNSSSQNKNSNQAGTNGLNKKVRSQAKEKPKQVNLANSSSKNSKDFLKNSVNKAKNTINSIHNNKKNSNEQNKNQQNGKQKNPIEQVGDEAAKKALSAVLQYYRVPKAVADKLVDKYGDKALDFVKKTTAIATVAAIVPIVLLLLILLSTTVSGDNSENKNEKISSYNKGTMSDEDFYNYLVENEMVSEDSCIDDDGKFTVDCDVMKYFSELKNNVDNSEQFLTIYYTMSYGREFSDLYSLYDSDELNSLLINKTNLKEYINGDYLTTYRLDFDPEFDLYSEIESDIFARSDKFEYSGEFAIDPETGFKMRIARAQRTNEFFYVNNPSNLEGECVWYAVGRANEILDSLGKKNKWWLVTDGGNYCSKSVKQGYVVNREKNNIEQGSLISWMYNTWGHVAVVEKVNRDSAGNVESIEITEGGLGFYSVLSSYLVGVGDNIVHFNGETFTIDDPRWDFVNKSIGQSTNAQRRQVLCESHGTGCQGYRAIGRDDIERNGQPKYDKDGNLVVKDFCTIPLSQFN